jgi:hypothetical protein
VKDVKAAASKALSATNGVSNVKNTLEGLNKKIAALEKK